MAKAHRLNGIGSTAKTLFEIFVYLSGEHSAAMHEEYVSKFYQTQTHHTRRIYICRKGLVDPSGIQYFLYP